MHRGFYQAWRHNGFNETVCASFALHVPCSKSAAKAHVCTAEMYGAEEHAGGKLSNALTSPCSQGPAFYVICLLQNLLMQDVCSHPTGCTASMLMLRSVLQVVDCITTLITNQELDVHNLRIYITGLPAQALQFAIPCIGDCVCCRLQRGI